MGSSGRVQSSDAERQWINSSIKNYPESHKEDKSKMNPLRGWFTAIGVMLEAWWNKIPPGQERVNLVVGKIINGEMSGKALRWFDTDTVQKTITHLRIFESKKKELGAEGEFPRENFTAEIAQQAVYHARHAATRLAIAKGMLE